MTGSTPPSDRILKQASPHDNVSLQHQLFHGTTWHSRLLPSMHKFAYPYRYWGVNISALVAGQALPEVETAILSNSKILRKLPLNALLSKKIFSKKLLSKGLPLFSAKKKALQQFYPNDYLQGLNLQESNSLSKDKNFNNESKTSDKKSTLDRNESLINVQALEQRLIQAFTERTGSAPIGGMIGMVVCRNAGIYFSPVNFYLGFDMEQKPTHLLAEVSNTPWDKRHYYGFLLDGANTEFCHDKDFHVSPFNPIDQQYCWQVAIKSAVKNEDKKQSDNGLQVRIAINISDERGEVLKTGIKMSGIPMTATTIRESLRKNPLMNVTSLMRIYWHAFKLYAIKKVPYINYDEKLADSQQQNESTQKDIS
ncbi:DUF1365 domain-containing protein [Psychrobacter sp. DAB_AL32B]|uniref:DUF1365 domain-containing protein n=1 Tax=Psychrobacter sp. DAB_AL32B TaxID=1028414 RepID=UPI000B7D9EEA|nr:DUF1365 family protein [Psychrobacter sp. DAB_AL32B]OXL23708.1 DUF1365 domain-containing protein [Psychrobacter sp. DAB_AL32B]